jgi:hypothetical protein
VSQTFDKPLSLAVGEDGWCMHFSSSWWNDGFVEKFPELIF